jgi:hypothetical protein
MDTSLLSWAYPIGSVEQSIKGEAMATKLMLRAAQGETTEVRVNDDPDTIAAMLAVASKENHPFVVFTNAETGKDESFQPGRVVSFVAE